MSSQDPNIKVLNPEYVKEMLDPEETPIDRFAMRFVVDAKNLNRDFNTIEASIDFQNLLKARFEQEKQ